MADKLMYIPNNENYPICSLKLLVETFNTQLNEVLKVVKTTNKKTFS